MILFWKISLWRIVLEYVARYHGERNHQGKGNVILFPMPLPREVGTQGGVACRERLGGLITTAQRDRLPRPPMSILTLRDEEPADER